MSDAIVLEVAEQPTITLDAGTADPVARDEIEELQAEVAQIVASLSGYMAKSEVSYMTTAQVLALYE